MIYYQFIYNDFRPRLFELFCFKSLITCLNCKNIKINKEILEIIVLKNHSTIDRDRGYIYIQLDNAISKIKSFLIFVILLFES